jgi:hypothetical protein
MGLVPRVLRYFRHYAVFPFGKLAECAFDLQLLRAGGVGREYDRDTVKSDTLQRGQRLQPSSVLRSRPNPSP